MEGGDKRLARKRDIQQNIRVEDHLHAEPVSFPIALLDANWDALKVPLTTPAQVLTAVYLAGVLLPCLVTLWTIAREFTWKYAGRLCLRQVLGAALFSLILAWTGSFFGV